MSLDQKFADMTNVQQGKWLAWANSHDWGVREEPAEFIQHPEKGFCMKTACVVYDPQGEAIERMYSVTPRELRDWAGY